MIVKDRRLALGLSALSGVLIALSMPNFNVWLLGWVALIPLLVAVYNQPCRRAYLIALPFGLIWSIAVHNWYPDIFSPALGYFLIIAVGTFYAWLIEAGIWLQQKLPGSVKVLALPIAWTALEWLRFVAPVTRDWWFVLMAKSQWNFPPALQMLSITGFPGLSFLLLLVNAGLALLLIRWLKERRFDIPGLAAVAVALVVIIAGALAIPTAPSDTFGIAATTDMALHDPEIEETRLSQFVFDVNAELTREVVARSNEGGEAPAFVVWPENNLTDVDDTELINQLKALSSELGVYIVANVRWHTPAGAYNTALMIDPQGQETGRQTKKNLFPAEKVDTIPGPREFPVFDTPSGKVGLGICYDRHVTYVVRGLAKNGARIVLMPVDDDFNQNRWFPIFHATDGFFRAVENRVAMGLSTSSGISMVCDPYGRVTAMSGINTRQVIVGQTFTAEGQTVYTRFGDWFAIAISVMFGTAVIIAIFSNRRRRS